MSTHLKHLGYNKRSPLRSHENTTTKTKDIRILLNEMRANFPHLQKDIDFQSQIIYSLKQIDHKINSHKLLWLRFYVKNTKQKNPTKTNNQH